MKTDVYAILYAVALGCVCAGLLTVVGQFTSPYALANARADEKRQILGVLGVSFDARSAAAELDRIFDEYVRVRDEGDLHIYEYDGSVGGARVMAVPFSGPGLWGRIRGFLALEADGTTVRDVSFYEQEETPGLGGEIGADWFRRQFRGRRILDEEGRPGIRFRSGGVARPNEVDAITGATMTCDKVEAMLNKTIERLLQGKKKP